MGGESNIIEMPIGLRLEEFIANEERAYIEQTLRHNNGSREENGQHAGHQHGDPVPQAGVEEQAAGVKFRVAAHARRRS